MDDWYAGEVETMSISEFKATCLAVLDRVRRTRQPVLVTKRGVPVAEVMPPIHPATGRRQLGVAATDNWRIVGDIVTRPADDLTLVTADARLLGAGAGRLLSAG